MTSTQKRCELCGKAIRRHQSCLSYKGERYRHYACDDRVVVAARDKGQCPMAVAIVGGSFQYCQFLGTKAEVLKHVDENDAHRNVFGTDQERTWILPPR